MFSPLEKRKKKKFPYCSRVTPSPAEDTPPTIEALAFWMGGGGYRNKISGNDFYGNLPCDLSRGTRIFIYIYSPLQTGVVVQPPRPISNSKIKKEKKQLPLERIRLFSMSSSCWPPFPSVCVSITIMYSSPGTGRAREKK